VTRGPARAAWWRIGAQQPQALKPFGEAAVEINADAREAAGVDARQVIVSDFRRAQAAMLVAVVPKRQRSAGWKCNSAACAAAAVRFEIRLRCSRIKQTQMPRGGA
jgi:hypothetical protein